MENTNESAAGRQVQAVQTSCDVLEVLRERGPSGVTELAAELGVSKATVHGHLATLYSNEYVVKDGDQYRLSLRFLYFGEYTKHEVEIYEIARREVDELAVETGEVAQCMVPEHGHGIYLHKAVGDAGVQTRSSVGDRVHLHCTALGKVILSQLPEEHVDGIVDREGLPAMTENTITDRDALAAELAEIRDHGVAFDREEMLQGLRCCAAPLTGYDGQLYGSISVAGPLSRMKGDHFHEEVPEAVLGAANVVQINSTQV